MIHVPCPGNVQHVIYIRVEQSLGILRILFFWKFELFQMVICEPSVAVGTS